MSTTMTACQRSRQYRALPSAGAAADGLRARRSMAGINRGFWPHLLFLIPALAAADSTNNVVLDRYAGDLVRLQGDQMVAVKASQFLNAPYTLLYFGAGWCPDCRRFSPSLVAAYDAQPKTSRRFEVLLLTMDKTEDGLRSFMRTEKMTWPALAFHKMSGADDLKK